MEASAHNTLSLLADVRKGDRSAADHLFAKVYADLRQLAHRRIASERGVVTISATGLVHEVYLKMVDGGDWTDRSHFLAVAARAMREILIDRARARNAAKRGGGVRTVTLDAELVGTEDDVLDQVLALDAALTQLAVRDGDLAQMVVLRFFGGLEMNEAAEVQGVSVRTAARRWSRAKAHLRTLLDA